MLCDLNPIKIINYLSKFIFLTLFTITCWVSDRLGTMAIKNKTNIKIVIGILYIIIQYNFPPTIASHFLICYNCKIFSVSAKFIPYQLINY